MATPVVMPQMGESIAEGTIVRWIKKVGDSVDRDEPLFEISTDKVDAEIPSPAAGTLLEISVKEGETVAVNSVVATIGAAGESVAAAPAAAKAEAPAATAAPPSGKTQPHSAQADGTPRHAARRTVHLRTWHLTHPSHPLNLSHLAPVASRPAALLPLVRRIAKEHGVDIGAINGSGIGGRVTKQDILGYLESPGAASAHPGIRLRSPRRSGRATAASPTRPLAAKAHPAHLSHLKWCPCPSCAGRSPSTWC